VVPRVNPVLGGEPHDHRAAGTDRRGPPARPDQLITGTGESRGGARSGERLTREAVEFRQRRPGRRITRTLCTLIEFQITARQAAAVSAANAPRMTT